MNPLPRHSFGWGSKLRKADEFSSVFRFRCAQRGQWLEVMVMPNDLERARLGMIVSRRFLPRAVDRNRLKRWIREMFRQRQETLSSGDFVVRLIAPPASPLQEQAARLREECQNLFNQALVRAARKSPPIPG